MYVMCIDNSHRSGTITKGKVYKALESSYMSPYVDIIDDKGQISLYDGSRFKPLKENKINRLLYKDL